MAIGSGGTLLQVFDTTVSPDDYVTIAEVLSITGPEKSAAQIETTPISASSKEYISDLPDQGTVSFDLNYTGDTAHHNLEDDVDAGTARSYRVSFPQLSPTVNRTFSATVESYSMSAEQGSQVKASVSLKITGTVTRT